MKRLTTIVFLAIFLLSGSLVRAGDTLPAGRFVPRDFGRYMISDSYSPVTKIHLGLGSNGADYNNDPRRSNQLIVLQEYTLGTDVPLYTGQFRLGNRPVRFSVSGALSAVVWFDFLNSKSSPILNVDYRLSFPEFHFLKEFSGHHIKNIVLRIAPIQHESTHIGDELTLYRKEAGFAITRINISYESGEMSLTLNDPVGYSRKNHAFTLGGRLLYRNDETDGFYTMQPWEGNPAYYIPSSKRFESYFRYQFESREPPLRLGNFYPVLSAELRHRVRFAYPYYENDNSSANGVRLVPGSERIVPCINVYAGWRKTLVDNGLGHIGGYFKFYSGINPHGQFRNIPNYTFLGLALVYEN
jgi:hypothetical protein